MKAWEEYALISEGEVKDVCVFKVGGYTDAQHVAQAIHGSDAIAVEVSYTPVEIGDSYQNGFFYHEGKVVQSLPTEEEAIAAHDRALDELTIAILEG